MKQQSPPPAKLEQRSQTRAAVQTHSTRCAAAAPTSTRAEVVAAPAPEKLVTAGSASHVSMELSPGAASHDSLGIAWRSVELGTNQSYGCTIAAAPGDALSVRILQPPYDKTLSASGCVDIAVVPVATAGTAGKLIVRNETTGATAELSWSWQAGKPGRSVGSTGVAKTGAQKAAAARLVAGAAKALQGKLGAAHAKEAMAFYGQLATGRRFAFILDMSGSMEGSRWRSCSRELVRTLDALSEDAEFFVVLFSSGLSEPPGQSGWTRATRDRSAAVVQWLSTIRPQGATYPAPAFDRVFSLSRRPDAVFFLTDGALEGFTPADCARVCATRTTSVVGSALRRLARLFSLPGADDAPSAVINTIALDDTSSERALVEMASASGGQYVNVASDG